MCLAVPGKIIRWINHDPVLAAAEVEFGGARRVCSMACVPEAAAGDYVLVHAGVGITRIDEEAARLVFEELKNAGDRGDAAEAGLP
ncbi:MAG: HypC/HybG/HupF family hydrogenase formation chaperone [Planctomycetia bacterium]|nr:HypC/HybG/HupF family hydrogenase formation chaperone [Planctomycetia bacterium]